MTFSGLCQQFVLLSAVENGEHRSVTEVQCMLRKGN